MVTIGEVIGRSLRFEEISPEATRRELRLPATVVNMLLDAWAAAIGQPALVTSTVMEITGRPARTFRDWVTDLIAIRLPGISFFIWFGAMLYFGVRWRFMQVAVKEPEYRARAQVKKKKKGDSG